MPSDAVYSYIFLMTMEGDSSHNTFAKTRSAKHGRTATAAESLRHPIGVLTMVMNGFFSWRPYEDLGIPLRHIWQFLEYPAELVSTLVSVALACYRFKGRLQKYQTLRTRNGCSIAPGFR